MSTRHSSKDGNRYLRYAEVASAYRLRERDLVTFLRLTFGKGEFHVKRAGDEFTM